MLRTNTIEYAFPTQTTKTLAPAFNKVFSYNGSAYTDYTTAASNNTTNDIIFSGTLNSEWYFGMDDLFFGFKCSHSNNGTTGVLVWEYSKGSGVWGTLTPKTQIQGTNDRLVGQSETSFSFNPPSDWATDTVNSETKYWIRARVTTAYGVTPTGSYVVVGDYANFASITVNIPETTSRTFRSAFIEFTAREAATSGASACISSASRIKIGSSAWANDITNNPQNTQFWVVRSNSGKLVQSVADHTATFTSDFGNSTSETIELSFGLLNTEISQQGTANNVTAKLIITYDYDDSATTRIKTVRIPLESKTNTLTNTLAEIGTNQIPALDTFLPEASKTYRDIFFQFDALENDVAATDFQLGLALDNEAEVLDGSHEAANNNNPQYRFLWKRTDMDTSVVHAFKARSTLTDRFESPAVVLIVTYEYNEADTTSVINSVMLPWTSEQTLALTSGAANVIDSFVSIQEPGTISLVQSGVFLQTLFVPSTIGDILIKIGSQAYRTYTVGSTSTPFGSFQTIQRFDSGSAQGAGASLARGINNEIQISTYKNSTTNYAGALTGVIYLNYTSGKSASKTGAHNKTVLLLAKSFFTYRQSDQDVWSYGYNITESNYYLSNYSFMLAGGVSETQNAFRLLAENKTNEIIGNSLIGIASIPTSNQSNAITKLYQDVTKYYRLFPNDLSNKLNPETTRNYYYQIAQIFGYIEHILTYNTITYTAAGTVTGYTGDGSGIEVEIHRKDTDELVGRVTTTTGGSYTFTWYDDTVELYAQARQDSTHLGRSDDTLAS